MDRAKAVNLLLTNGGKVTDYWGFGRASRPLLPAIGVPTTAGTGSEAQSYALISDTKTHRKMACGDRKMRFRTVILDPALPATAAQKVVAVAGIDAVSHAIESYVSTRSNPISQLFSRTAWELLDRNASSIAGREGSEEGFGELLLGAHLAGAAIEQSMLGATHACANPLTAQFDVAHGEAIAVLLPWVIRFNAEAVDGRYRSLLSGTGEQSARDYGESLACRVESIRHAASLPAALRDLDIPHSALPELAAQAADEWTARFNPRPVDQTTLLQVYESAF